MAQSDSKFWNMYNASRTEAMSADQEQALANDLRRAKAHLWESIFSDLNNIDMVIVFFFNKLSEVKGKREPGYEVMQGFHSSVIRWRRRPIQANESQVRRRRLDCIASLVEFDACMELPSAFIQSLKGDSDYSYEYKRTVILSYDNFTRLRNRFIERNVRLVMMISKRFVSYGIPREDLVQEGIFGLSRAVGTFDPDLGFKFSTYASWWIRAVITRYCRNHSRMVRVPVGLQERLERYYAAARRLDAEGEDFNINTIAKMTGIPVKTAKKLQSMTLEHCCSIDAEGDSGVRVRDILEDPDNQLAGVDVAIDHLVISRIMENLPERLQYIIRARNGLDGGEGRTLQEIADTLKLSRERIRQLEGAALDLIRKELESFHEDG